MIPLTTPPGPSNATSNVRQQGPSDARPLQHSDPLSTRLDAEASAVDCRRPTRRTPRGSSSSCSSSASRGTGSGLRSGAGEAATGARPALPALAAGRFRRRRSQRCRDVPARPGRGRALRIRCIGRPSPRCARSCASRNRTWGKSRELT